MHLFSKKSCSTLYTLCITVYSLPYLGNLNHKVAKQHDLRQALRKIRAWLAQRSISDNL